MDRLLMCSVPMEFRRRPPCLPSFRLYLISRNIRANDCIEYVGSHLRRAVMSKTHHYFSLKFSECHRIYSNDSNHSALLRAIDGSVSEHFPSLSLFLLDVSLALYIPVSNDLFLSIVTCLWCNGLAINRKLHLFYTNNRHVVFARNSHWFVFIRLFVGSVFFLDGALSCTRASHSKNERNVYLKL